MADSSALLALLHQEIGDRPMRNLLTRFDSPERSDFEDALRFLEERLPPNKLEKLRRFAGQDGCLEQLEARLHQSRVRVLKMHDPLYPQSLLHFQSPPPILYTMGDIHSINLPGIGICGSRKASQEGLDHAESSGKITAAEGATEVSGYARGVDEEAHLGALRAGGKSIAVLAEGILHFRQKRTFRDIPDMPSRMVVISEFPPQRPWTVYNAMKRNKTILGLSRALIVVEAASKGGTLNAGLECLKRGKLLWVLKYTDKRESRTGNQILIEKGGIPVRTESQLRSLIRGAMSQSKGPTSDKVKQGSLAI